MTIRVKEDGGRVEEVDSKGARVDNNRHKKVNL